MKALKCVPALFALALLALVAIPWGPGENKAEAFPNADNVAVVSQACLSDGSVGINVAWTAYNQGGQWVDLTLFDNGFVPGTFIGLGPLAAGQNSFIWEGIRPGLRHFLRINTLTGFGWQPSFTAAFFSRGDCLPYPAGNASNVSVPSQSCLQNGRVAATMTWTPSGQGVQWADLSLFDNGFAPATFVGVGPMPPGQSSLTWDGLLPGYYHFLRINTGAPGGWAPSPRVAFFTRPDCAPALPATPVATATPSG
jgi:hypothetical protein